MGDACVLGSAVFYAAATVRLGIYASRFPAVKLALAKTMTLGAISTAWLASEIAEGLAVPC